MLKNPRNSILEKFYTSSGICLLSLSDHTPRGLYSWDSSNAPGEIPSCPSKGPTIPNKGTNFASSFYKAFYGPGCLK